MLPHRPAMVAAAITPKRNGMEALTHDAWSPNLLSEQEQEMVAAAGGRGGMTGDLTESRPQPQAPKPK